MYFVIIATDQPDSLNQRLAHRAAHRARLDDLMQANRLLTAGPLPHAHHQAPDALSFSGSVIIADFADLAAAKAWADADPYVAHSVYQSVSVQPYLPTYWAAPTADPQAKR